MLSLTAIAALMLADANPELEKKARALVEQLIKGDFKTPQSSFTDKMQAGLSEAKLGATWKQLNESAGKLKSVGAATLTHESGYDIVTLAGQFEQASLDIRVVFDGDKKIAGLFFRPGPSGASVEPLARAFVAQLQRGEFEAATTSFDGTMSSALPAAKIAEVMKPFGKLEAVNGVRLEPSGGYQVALVGCRFEKGPFTVKVVFDATKRVAGLFFLPGDLSVSWSPPPYAGAVTERDVSVGQVPGKLTIPAKGKGPFPAVVLVQGSGMHDEDETIGPNKVFKDLALGLSSRGIVVLRYVKHPPSVATIQDEVIKDAEAAIDVLKAQPEVDKKRVAVLGHSLGAYLMPWMLRDRADVYGVVMLAAPARGLMDLVVEQHEYFLSLHPGDAQVLKALNEVKQMKARSEAKDLKGDERVYNAPGTYWLSMRDYKPVEVAAAQKAPMLVLQGERDYQVQFKTDFASFQKGLKGHVNVMLKSYPKLNHLFMSGEGPSTPEEYQRAAHVDEAVVRDVADWLSKN